MAVIQPTPFYQFFDDNGAPLAGGKILTYEAGTTTPLATYADSAATTPLANPIVLDSAGRATVYWDGDYQITVTDSADVTVRTVDNFSTATATGSAFLSVVQVWTAAQQAEVTALTSTSNSIATNLALSNNFSHTLTENTTLANPSNVVAGQSGAIMITQDASTARTLAYGSFWKFPAGSAPSVTATLSAGDTLFYNVRSTIFIEANLVKGFA